MGQQIRLWVSLLCVFLHCVALSVSQPPTNISGSFTGAAPNVTIPGTNWTVPRPYVQLSSYNFTGNRSTNDSSTVSPEVYARIESLFEQLYGNLSATLNLAKPLLQTLSSLNISQLALDVPVLPPNYKQCVQELRADASKALPRYKTLSPGLISTLLPSLGSFASCNGVVLQSFNVSNSPFLFNVTVNNTLKANSTNQTEGLLHEDSTTSAARQANSNVVVIQVIFYNMVDNSTGKNEGYAQWPFFQAQIDQMNRDYGNVPFVFQLYEVYAVADAQAYHVENGLEDENNAVILENMKRTYRAYSDTPPYNILYIYTVSFGASGLLGFATFPWDLPAKSDIDGIVIDIKTLPGLVPDNVFSSGTTASHEAGHWLGLFHPFENLSNEDGCSGGDYVDDTPIQRGANYKTCAAPFDSSITCVDDQGNVIFPNPYNNLDYAEDYCKPALFTQGQGDRQVQWWTACRTGSDLSKCPTSGELNPLA